jgi:hypothetical protein
MRQGLGGVWGVELARSPALRTALKAQCESVALEGSVKTWDADARLLVFPRDDGRPLVYRDFIRSLWRPLSRRAGLPLPALPLDAAQLCDLAAGGGD